MSSVAGVMYCRCHVLQVSCVAGVMYCRCHVLLVSCVAGVCSTCIRIGGKKRNGMFLQAAYLGVAIGSVCGPFVARPFLSTVAQVEVDEEDEIISSYINSQ